MENKKGTAKVTGASPNGSWNGMFKFQYTLDDGTSLTAMHKDNAPRFAVGETVDYEITKVTAYGNNGKLSKPQTDQPFAPKVAKSYGGGKKQSWAESIAITRDACLGAACEFYQKTGGATPALAGQLADRFVNFVIHGTPAQDFDMWSAVHKNLIHRNSVVKSAVKLADDEDECIKYAMDLIKYVDRSTQPAEITKPAPQPVQQQTPPPTAPMVEEEDGDLPF